MPKPTPTRNLTTAEVATRLGVRTQTVINHVRAGRLIPIAKLPTPTGTYLFDPVHVEAFAAEYGADEAAS